MYRRAVGSTLCVPGPEWATCHQAADHTWIAWAHSLCPCCVVSVQTSGTKWSSTIETQLCYEIKTFLLAGHETSAAMLMWSVFELGRNEQARQQVSGLYYPF